MVTKVSKQDAEIIGRALLSLLKRKSLTEFRFRKTGEKTQLGTGERYCFEVRDGPVNNEDKPTNWIEAPFFSTATDSQKQEALLCLLRFVILTLLLHAFLFLSVICLLPFFL